MIHGFLLSLPNRLLDTERQSTDTQKYIPVKEIGEKYERAFPEKENRLQIKELGKLIHIAFPGVQKKRLTLKTEKDSSHHEWVYNHVEFVDTVSKKVVWTDQSQTHEMPEWFWTKIPSIFKHIHGFTLTNNSNSFENSVPHKYEWVYADDNERCDGRVVRELYMFRNFSFKLMIMGKAVASGLIPVHLNMHNFQDQTPAIFHQCSKIRLCFGFKVERNS